MSSIGNRRSAAQRDGTAAYQKRRKEITDAAICVFNQVGYKEASIGLVAEQLGTDRASLYYYISSKEELFDEIVGEVVKENVAIVQRIQKGSSSPRNKLRDLIVTVMTSYGKHYPLMFIYIRENLSHVSKDRAKWAQQMRKLNRDFEKAVTAIIEQGYADGSFRRIGPAKIVAYGIIGMMNFTHRWFKPSQLQVSAADIGSLYADLNLAGLSSGE